MVMYEGTETVTVELTPQQWAQLAYTANIRKNEHVHRDPQQEAQRRDEWDEIISSIDEQVTSEGYRTVYDNF